MERVKDISKLKLYPGAVLIKLYMNDSKIISPDMAAMQKDVQVDYAEVIACAPDITDLSVGDIILEFRSTGAFRWHGGEYMATPRMNIKLAVEKDDIDLTKKVSKKMLN